MIENCPMRHENGNCIPAGGFCTANKNICEALLNAYRMGKAQLSKESATSDLISRQAAIDLVTDMEFMNFTAKGILRESLRKLSPAQPELDSENLVRMIEFGITATNSRDAYSLGMRNGMRWCKSLIDGVEPKFEDDVMSVDDGKELPSAQPEYRLDEWCHDCKEYDQEHRCCPRFNRVIREALKDAQLETKEGHWIPHETPDGGEQYECSECGVLWEFNDGTPEDNGAYFCPKCGTKMKGERT